MSELLGIPARSIPRALGKLSRRLAGFQNCNEPSIICAVVLMLNIRLMSPVTSGLPHLRERGFLFDICHTIASRGYLLAMNVGC
jgi:hypothetical protein